MSSVRRLTPRGRLVLLGAVAGITAVICVALMWSVTVVSAARLVAGVRDTVVVNHLRPIALPMQVLDSNGRVLSDTGVRYEQLTGAPLTVSSRGLIDCALPGNATVRASLGAISSTVLVLCQPVRKVRVVVWNDFIVGDPPRALPAEFEGVDGSPVTLLRARVAVRDSTIATLDGLEIRPLRPGRTNISVQVGNRASGGLIRVYAPVQTLDGLRPLQRPADRHVAAAVRLEHGESIRWPLPTGLFSLTFLSRPDNAGDADVYAAMPGIRVDGPVMCLPTPGPRVYTTDCLVRGPGATVTLTHAGAKSASVVGALALAWTRER